MNIMFYDMGAYATQVSVVSYQLIKSKDKIAPELQPQLTVLGVGFVYNLKFLCKVIKKNWDFIFLKIYLNISSDMHVIWVAWKYNYV